jgi:hypothetical protein
MKMFEKDKRTSFLTKSKKTADSHACLKGWGSISNLFHCNVYGLVSASADCLACWKGWVSNSNLFHHNVYGLA